MKPQPIYDQWTEGNYPNPGGFELSLMQTYQRASGTNRAKLKRAYPEYFGEEMKPAIRFFMNALDESTWVQTTLDTSKRDISTPSDELREFLIDRIKDGANPIDLYMEFVGDYPNRERIFFETLNEITEL